MKISVTLLHFSYIFQAITWAILTIKVLSTYKRNKNFVSILIGIAFIAGIVLSIFSPLHREHPEIYGIYFEGALTFYIAGLATIVFYILDWQYVVLAPFTIAAIASLQYFISPVAYDINTSAINYTMGFLPIFGFLYLASKKKDAKSFSMGIQIIFIVIGNISADYSALIAAIMTFASSGILLIGFFGGFDRFFRQKAEIEGEILESEITTG
ncbi:MAG: hypothetical protein ACFFCS_29935 [Candidatus Hodarchaeota archaeon]